MALLFIIFLIVLLFVFYVLTIILKPRKGFSQTDSHQKEKSDLPLRVMISFALFCISSGTFNFYIPSSTVGQDKGGQPVSLMRVLISGVSFSAVVSIIDYIDNGVMYSAITWFLCMFSFSLLFVYGFFKYNRSIDKE